MHTPVNPAFGRLRQKDQMLKVSLSYIMKYRPTWAHETLYQIQANPISFRVRRENERDSMDA